MLPAGFALRWFRWLRSRRRGCAARRCGGAKTPYRPVARLLISSMLCAALVPHALSRMFLQQPVLASSRGVPGVKTRMAYVRWLPRSACLPARRTWAWRICLRTNCSLRRNCCRARALFCYPLCWLCALICHATSRPAHIAAYNLASWSLCRPSCSSVCGLAARTVATAARRTFSMERRDADITQTFSFSVLPPEHSLLRRAAVMSPVSCT